MPSKNRPLVGKGTAKSREDREWEQAVQQTDKKNQKRTAEIRARNKAAARRGGKKSSRVPKDIR